MIYRAIDKGSDHTTPFEIILMRAAPRKYEEGFHQCSVLRHCQVQSPVQSCPKILNIPLRAVVTKETKAIVVKTALVLHTRVCKAVHKVECKRVYKVEEIVAD